MTAKPYNGHYSDKLLCDWCGELLESTTDVSRCDCGREVDSMELAQQWYVDAVEEIKRLTPFETNLRLTTTQRDNAEWKLQQIEKLLTDRGYPEATSPTETQSIGYRIKKLCDMADELKAIKQSTPAAPPQKG